MKYQDVNARTIDGWCRSGWEWGVPITHEAYAAAQAGEWGVYLTPTKHVPRDWLGDLRGKRILGLASGGGQQIPIFSALGARCTVLDYSQEQCERERMVARREGYDVEVIRADMTEPLPFGDGTFDLVFHPVSNCYVERVEPIFRECFRVLKEGGRLLGGFDIGINYIFDESQTTLAHRLPFNPLRDPQLYEDSLRSDEGIQFSHTLEEQIGGQLRAGFRLLDLYEDTNGQGRLHDHNVPTFIATCAIKEE